VKKVSVEKFAHNRGDPTHTIEIGHKIVASWAEVGDLRSPLAYAGNVIEL